MAKRKKTAKKKAAKKKATKPRGPTLRPGVLVSEESDKHKTTRVYEGPKGVTVATHYEGARVVEEGASKLSSEVIYAENNKAKECPNCSGTNTQRLKSNATTVSYRCYSCVGRDGRPYGFFLRRITRPT